MIGLLSTAHPLSTAPAWFGSFRSPVGRYCPTIRIYFSFAVDRASGSFSKCIPRCWQTEAGSIDAASLPNAIADTGQPSWRCSSYRQTTAEAARAIYDLPMLRSVRWLLWSCALLCRKVNAQYWTTSSRMGQGVRCRGLQLQEIGAGELDRFAPTVLRHDREEVSRGLLHPPLRL